MKDNFKIINKKNLHNGFFKLKELTIKYKKHNGSWSNPIKREIFGGAHVSTVLPYDSKNKKILLIKQFRPGVIKQGINPIVTEIVAGIIDEGENPEEAAKRECEEETGCKVNNLIKICSYFPAPGSSESFYHLFLGEVDSFNGTRITGQDDENEDILVKSYTIDEVRQLLKKNKIINGLSIIALQWFFLEYYKS